MADIFLSYTEKDREAVRRLADTLQSVGWSVWWDRRIPAGLTWRNVLDRELRSMRCMVVLWSSHSVLSDWVCEEAAEGRQLGRLVPVLIERVRPPAGFREIQAADLVDWDGSRDSVGVQRLVEDIERLIGKPGLQAHAASEPEPDEAQAGRVPTPPPPTRQPFPWGLSALLVAIAVGAYYGTVARRPADARSEVVRAPLKGAAPAPGASSVDAANASAPRAPSVAAASPPAGKASDPSPPVGARHVPVPSSLSARCVALQERLALGETLSSQSQLFFRQECRK